MWDLKAGRNQFLGSHQGMPDRSFWYYVLKSANDTKRLNDPSLQAALRWSPHYSNCPQLDHEITALLADREVNKSWKGFLRTIFVGRTLGGEINAKAKQRSGKAWVGVSFQYSSAIMAYVAAYDKWRAVMSANSGADPKKVLDADIFSGIATSRPFWADPSAFVGTHPSLSRGPDGRDENDYERLVTYADMFLVCHEYGHHLLGHTNNFAKKFKIEEDLRNLLKQRGLEAVVFRRTPSRKEPRASAKAIDTPAVSQKEEFLADILGLQLASKSRGADRTAAVDFAMIGTICALLAEADIMDHWFLDSLDTHPSMFERIGLLLNLMPTLFHSYPTHGIGDSVKQLTQQLAGFSTACFQYSMCSRYPDSYPVPTMGQIFQAFNDKTLVRAVFE